MSTSPTEKTLESEQQFFGLKPRTTMTELQECHLFDSCFDMNKASFALIQYNENDVRFVDLIINGRQTNLSFLSQTESCGYRVWIKSRSCESFFEDFLRDGECSFDEADHTLVIKSNHIINLWNSLHFTGLCNEKDPDAFIKINLRAGLCRIEYKKQVLVGDFKILNKKYALFDTNKNPPFVKPMANGLAFMTCSGRDKNVVTYMVGEDMSSMLVATKYRIYLNDLFNSSITIVNHRESTKKSLKTWFALYDPRKIRYIEIDMPNPFNSMELDKGLSGSMYGGTIVFGGYVTLEFAKLVIEYNAYENGIYKDNDKKNGYDIKGDACFILIDFNLKLITLAFDSDHFCVTQFILRKEVTDFKQLPEKNKKKPSIMPPPQSRPVEKKKEKRTDKPKPELKILTPAQAAPLLLKMKDPVPKEKKKKESKKRKESESKETKKKETKKKKKKTPERIHLIDTPDSEEEEGKSEKLLGMDMTERELETFYDKVDLKKAYTKKNKPEKIKKTVNEEKEKEKEEDLWDDEDVDEDKDWSERTELPKDKYGKTYKFSVYITQMGDKVEQLQDNGDEYEISFNTLFRSFCYEVTFDPLLVGHRVCQDDDCLVQSPCIELGPCASCIYKETEKDPSLLLPENRHKLMALMDNPRYLAGQCHCHEVEYTDVRAITYNESDQHRNEMKEHLKQDGAIEKSLKAFLIVFLRLPETHRIFNKDDRSFFETVLSNCVAYVHINPPEQKDEDEEHYYVIPYSIGFCPVSEFPKDDYGKYLTTSKQQGSLYTNARKEEARRQKILKEEKRSIKDSKWKINNDVFCGHICCHKCVFYHSELHKGKEGYTQLVNDGPFNITTLHEAKMFNLEWTTAETWTIDNA